MKKVIIVALAIIITGCSALPPLDLSFLTSPTTEPSSTSGPTVTLFPTKTNTPDLFQIVTVGPTNTPKPNETLPTSAPPTRTPTITLTLRPTITLEPLDPSLFTPSPNLFKFVSRSTNQIVWGSTCDGSRSIMFVVDVNYIRRLKYVLLFVRLQDKYSGRGTEWGAGAIMSDNDQGKYFYTLELDQIEDYIFYEDAWLQYQFVAATSGLTVLGRSVVDRTSVSVTHCKTFNMR